MRDDLSGERDGVVFGTINESNDIKNITIKKLPPAVFQLKDVIFAFSMLVCGFLYWELIHFVTLSLGVTVFAFLICLITWIYMRANGIRQNRRSLACLGLTIISALNFTLYDGPTLKTLNFLFLSGCFIYWICLSTDRYLEKRLSVYLIGDAISQTLIVPLSNFGNCFIAVKKGIVKNKHGNGFLAGVLGIIIFLPILIIIIGLLTSADVVFESFMSKIQELVSDKMGEYLLQFIFGIPVACYLYGLIYGDVKGRNTSKITTESLDHSAKSVQIAPKITVYSAITALNLIYLMFFISQSAYLFSAFHDMIPQTMTYAEYARRGFFQLCTVSGINLLIITVAYLLIKRNKEVPFMLRAHIILVSVFTMLFICTAVSKMILYIKYYGLTQLRIYTTWFMVLLFIIFFIVLIRQIKVFNASKAVIVSFIICFMALCYGNVDGQIAKYNIQRYEEGTLKMMDESAVNKLYDGAVPYLYKIYKNEEDENIKAMIYSSLTGDYGYYTEEDPYEVSYKDYNLQKSRADNIRAEMMSNPPKNIEESR
ncbi:DUF4153 domain-containing protein [Anaerovorax odorimutans]|uniref:DUF4153 domain-containing protein n=1 Tax=Anaerovorax odorimutans TaxID=109327 RepID=UPI000427DE0D|nr:DUF4173 domain-containing protein [Anaerovorax odorimutans]